MKNALKTLTPLLVAILPAAITGYFGYRQAQVEANAGYVTLVKTVEDLQDEVKELHDQVLILQDRAERPSSLRMGSSPNTDGDGLVAETPKPPPPTRVNPKKKLPQSLRQAYIDGSF